MVRWLMLLQDSPRGGQTISGTGTAQHKEELGRERTTEITRHVQTWMVNIVLLRHRVIIMGMMTESTILFLIKLDDEARCERKA